MSHASQCIAMCLSHFVRFMLPLTSLMPVIVGSGCPSGMNSFCGRTSQLTSLLPYRYRVSVPLLHLRENAFSSEVRARIKAARRQAKSLKIHSAVYDGGQNAAAAGAGGGASMGPPVAWPRRSGSASSGEHGALVSRGGGGEPVAWPC